MRFWLLLAPLVLGGPTYSVNGCWYRHDGVIGGQEQRGPEQQEPDVPRRPPPTMPERVVHPALTEEDLRVILHWHRTPDAQLGTDHEREVHDMLVLYLCWLIRANGGVAPPDCDMDPSQLEPTSLADHTDEAGGAG